MLWYQLKNLYLDYKQPNNRLIEEFMNYLNTDLRKQLSQSQL